MTFVSLSIEKLEQNALGNIWGVSCSIGAFYFICIGKLISYKCTPLISKIKTFALSYKEKHSFIIIMYGNWIKNLFKNAIVSVATTPLVRLKMENQNHQKKLNSRREKKTIATKPTSTNTRRKNVRWELCQRNS